MYVRSMYPLGQDARQYYVLDSESTEEVREDWVNRFFKAADGDDVSSASGSSSSSDKKKKRKSKKKNKESPKKKKGSGKKRNPKGTNPKACNGHVRLL